MFYFAWAYSSLSRYTLSNGSPFPIFLRIASTLQVVIWHSYLGDVTSTTEHSIQNAVLSCHKNRFTKPQNTTLTNHLLLKAVSKSHHHAQGVQHLLQHWCLCLTKEEEVIGEQRSCSGHDQTLPDSHFFFQLDSRCTKTFLTIHALVGLCTSPYEEKHPLSVINKSWPTEVFAIGFCKDYGLSAKFCCIKLIFLTVVCLHNCATCTDCGNGN